ncbi:hypothetical protein CKAN_00578300 [Cinnamomum micranthum f. kanehirae]|uniref:Uncharacterized protein n=1 Tax=Cinnamomum micranthum f. kanehirae TaxID=337451 RepID=A0A3S3NXU7_9MAGN|nr:hypothetical protein CKAN_00578300 [Cinnamomum micranthum f. kanehirae]
MVSNRIPVCLDVIHCSMNVYGKKHKITCHMRQTNGCSIYGYERAAGVGVASMLLAMETLKLASNQASGKVAKSSSDSWTFGSQPQWDCSRAKNVILMHVERFNQLQEGRN